MCFFSLLKFKGCIWRSQYQTLHMVYRCFSWTVRWSLFQRWTLKNQTRRNILCEILSTKVSFWCYNFSVSVNIYIHHRFAINMLMLWTGQKQNWTSTCFELVIFVTCVISSSSPGPGYIENPTVSAINHPRKSFLLGSSADFHVLSLSILRMLGFSLLRNVSPWSMETPTSVSKSHRIHVWYVYLHLFAIFYH